MARIPLTLLVMARNEAHQLGRCLDSVPFADEKIVVDSGSRDRTRDVAVAHGARVVDQPWLGFGPQRNHASTLARNDWILFLDADEELSPALAAEIEARLPALEAERKAGAWLLRSASYMGRPMRFYRPLVGEKQGRLYHRGRARWTDVRVHETMVFGGPVETLRAPFLHHQSPTLVHQSLKTLRYGELKAQTRVDAGRPPGVWALPLVFLAAFVRDYLFRLACLDGWRGLAVAWQDASYAAYQRLRAYELTVNPDSRSEAARALEQHGLDD
ncbi:MAG: glycosyltransferase family 2 protein [Anaeromyxobacteraceae bacterium]